MALKRKLNLFLLLLMLAAQGALAHHATVHFALHGAKAVTGHVHSQGHNHDPSNHPAPKSDEHCSICVLTHSLSHSDLVVLPLWEVEKKPDIFVLKREQKAADQILLLAYQARAPPVFLI